MSDLVLLSSLTVHKIFITSENIARVNVARPGQVPISCQSHFFSFTVLHSQKHVITGLIKELIIFNCCFDYIKVKKRKKEEEAESRIWNAWAELTWYWIIVKQLQFPSWVYSGVGYIGWALTSERTLGICRPLPSEMWTEHERHVVEAMIGPWGSSQIILRWFYAIRATRRITSSFLCQQVQNPLVTKLFYL